MKSFLYKTPSLVLCISAGLLLFIAWPPSGLFIFSFIAFALLFVAEEKIPTKKYHFFWHIYLAMFIWNIATTYWVFFATPIGSLAWILNALFMTLPWLLYRTVKRHYGLRIGLLAFTGAWLSFEWLHFTWELAWPWLTLGNVFAKTPAIVQWYEFTGTGGGTLWILLINILVFLLLKTNSSNKNKTAGSLSVLIVLPVVVSIIIGSTYKSKGKESEFLLIQPNFNPYVRDFSFAENQRILNTLLRLGSDNITDSTDYVVYPESSLPGNPWKTQLNNYSAITKLSNLLDRTDEGSILIGADVLRLFGENEDLSATARYVEDNDFYYDLYNASLFVPKEGATEFYAKSKLVPGVERMPYPKYLQPLQQLAINLGGIGGSRATQKERTVFDNGSTKVGTGICYESVFGDYMNDFVKNGAEVLVIITNDGWWKNTSGYKQHLHYARLRAIETRRSVARSANTGISAFINQKGTITQQTDWWTEATLTGTVYANNQITFYTRYGDYIYRVGLLFTFIVSLITLVKANTNNFKFRS